MKGDLQCRRRLLQLQIVVALIIWSPLVHGQPDSTDACETATLESEPSRYFNESSMTNRCDSGLATGWYRFELNGRHAEITTRCIKNNHCGTELPLHIELEGNDLPDVNQTLKAYVCGSYNILGKWDCCVLRKTVYIKNCTTFYAYHLQPTDRCPVGYCLQVKGEYPLSNMTVKTGEPVPGGSQGPVGAEGSVQQPITPQANSTTTTSIVNITTSTVTLPTQAAGSAPPSTTSNSLFTSTTVSNVSTAYMSSSTESSTSPVTTSISNTSTTAIVAKSTEGNTSRSSNSSVGTTLMSSESQTTPTPIANTSSSSSTIQSTVTNSSTNSTMTTVNQPPTRSTDLTTVITQSNGGVTEPVTESNVSIASTNQPSSSVLTTNASSDISTPSTVGDVSSTTSASSSSSTPSNAVTANITEACNPNISESFRCGNSSCFRLSGGRVYVYCMVENARMACVVACNSYPDCIDGADETPDLCPTNACPEGQRGCPNKSGCHNDCNDRNERLHFTVQFSLNGSRYANFQASFTQATFNEDVRRAVNESFGNLTAARVWFENYLVSLDANLSRTHNVDVSFHMSESGYEQLIQNRTFLDLVAAHLLGNTSDGQVRNTVSPTNSSSSPITNNTDSTLPSATTTTSVASSFTNRSVITHASNTTYTSTRSTIISQSIYTSPPISSNASVTSPVTNSIATSDQSGQTTGVSSPLTSSSASIDTLDTSTVTSERATTWSTPHNVSYSTAPTLLTTTNATGTSSSIQNSSSTPDNTPRNETLPESTYTTTASSTHLSSSTLTHEINHTTTRDNGLASSNISTVRTTAPTMASTLSNTTISVSPSDTTSQSETTPTTTSVRSNEATTGDSIRTTGESISSSSSSTVTLVTTGLSSPTTREPSSTVYGTSTSSSQFETTSVKSTSVAQLSSTSTIISTLIESQTSSTHSTSESLTRSTASLLSTESTSSIQTTTSTPSSDNVSSTEKVGKTATTTEDTSILDNHTSDILNTVETTTDIVNDDDNEIVKLFKQNTGLFIFLIIAGTAIIAICIFGIGGTIYQKRMRTWQPDIDDTYPDMDKSIISIGRERSGIESPIADIDILQEETGEGESISKASTLVCGPTPDRLQGTYPRSNDTPVTGTSTGNSPRFGSLNGHANEAYQSEESLDSDGVTPYEELDERYPRNKFPWIENAEDTKV